MKRGCCTVVVRLFRIQKVGGSIPLISIMTDKHFGYYTLQCHYGTTLSNKSE